MAKVWSTNVALATNFGSAVYQLVNFLRSHGWSVVGAGDGTSYDNTTPATALTYFSLAVMTASPACWVRIQHSTGRELVFARGAANYVNWFVAYSKSAGFTGGSPSATQCPTATDQGVMIGTSPTSFAVWFSDSLPAHVNLCADASSPYGFYMWVIKTGSARMTQGGHIVWDPLSGVSASNTDPFVFYVPNGSTAGLNFRMAITASTTGKSMAGGDAQLFALNGSGTLTECNALHLYASASASSIAITSVTASGVDMKDTYNATNDACIPLFIADAGSTTDGVNFYLGFTTWMKFSIFQYANRVCGATNTISSASDYIYVGTDDDASTSQILLPWDGGSWTG